MVKLSKTFKYVIRKARSPFVRLKLYIKKKMSWLGVPIILPYMGFGNGRDVFISGSVIEDRSLSRPVEGQGWRSNLMATVRRYAGDEFAGVQVQVEFGGRKLSVETDEDGMFRCRFRFDENELPRERWQKARFRLLDEIVPGQPAMPVSGDVLVVCNRPEQIILSDVDDTFLVSHSTKFFRKIRLLLFRNALTRLPFPGVAAFYKALVRGKEKDGFNPIFFVSSSEWNLYDLLIEFCNHRGIPRGPFLLKKMRTSVLDFLKSGGGHHEHKLEKFRYLFEMFKDSEFILIGDSGQKDPEIFLTIAKEFPGRIRAIYIRCIGSEKKLKRTRSLSEEARSMNVDMILAENTEAAARHAVEKGYIDRGSLPGIISEKKEDLRKG